MLIQKLHLALLTTMILATTNTVTGRIISDPTEQQEPKTVVVGPRGNMLLKSDTNEERFLLRKGMMMMEAPTTLWYLQYTHAPSSSQLQMEQDEWFYDRWDRQLSISDGATKSKTKGAKRGRVVHVHEIEKNQDVHDPSGGNGPSSGKGPSAGGGKGPSKVLGLETKEFSGNFFFQDIQFSTWKRAKKEKTERGGRGLHAHKEGSTKKRRNLHAHKEGSSTKKNRNLHAHKEGSMGMERALHARTEGIMGMNRNLHAHKEGSMGMERTLHAHKEGGMGMERSLHAHNEGSLRMERNLHAHKKTKRNLSENQARRNLSSESEAAEKKSKKATTKLTKKKKSMDAMKRSRDLVSK